MIEVAILICGTFLVAQHQEHKQARRKLWDAKMCNELIQRLEALEDARVSQYDPAAFNDLRDKVEALRMAQGLRSSR